MKGIWMNKDLTIGLRVLISLSVFSLLFACSNLNFSQNKNLTITITTTDGYSNNDAMMPKIISCDQISREELSANDCKVIDSNREIKNSPTPVSFFENDTVPIVKMLATSSEAPSTLSLIPSYDQQGKVAASTPMIILKQKNNPSPEVTPTLESATSSENTPTPHSTPTPKINLLGKANLISPEGIINSAQPAYIWEMKEEVKDYKLMVKGTDDKVLFEEWSPAADICGKTKCEKTPNLSLAAGDYTWLILTRNANGEGEWSEPMSFTVVAPPPPPGAATPVSPSGSLLAGLVTPIFAWSGVYNASAYRLAIKKADGSPVFDQWVGAEEVCSGITCQVTPALALAGGDYLWLVQTRNAGGNGPESSPLAFTISP